MLVSINIMIEILSVEDTASTRDGVRFAACATGN